MSGRCTDIRLPFALLTVVVALTLSLRAQEHAHTAPVALVPFQPLALQARRLETTLQYLGQPLSEADRRAINDTLALGDERAASARLQQVLDAYVLVTVHINPESRVSVEQGPARPELVQGGTRLFIVKVINDAGVTAPLTVRSPNSGRVYIPSRNSPEPPKELTDVQVRERWAEISMYDKSPMRARLSGLPVEYALLQVYSRDAGQRSATISFDVGQGTQDIGFRNDLDVVFTALPVHHVAVRVRDEQGRPTTAAFLIHDALGRLYPNVSKRLAPDFFFQPQVYRADGSTIDLPPGSFTIVVSRGPEYVAQTAHIEVPRTEELSFTLARWIDPASQGWFSGDHHIHAAGCSHYENPSEGVLPQDMWPQIDGEALNVGVRADVGSVVTTPEAVLHRARPSAVDADAIDALRPRDLRFSLEPCRSPRAAWLEGSGLSRRHASGGLAELDLAGPALGESTGSRRRLRTFGVGSRGAERASCRTMRCPASTASAPTNSSSTSPSRTPWTSSRRATRRTCGS